MAKNKKYIIIAVVVVVVIGVIIIYKRAKKQHSNNVTTERAIPEELQKSISGFDEGESVTVQGVRYIVKNGAWQQVIN